MRLNTVREIKTNVEQLNEVKIACISLDPETARWAAKLPPALYNKLAAVGLVPKRAEQVTLGPFLDSHIAGRSDVKGATAIVYGHTRRCLVDYFGAGKAGLTPWPKLFNNLRSTRQTALSEKHQAHVVCAWMGNSVRVADEHYLQVTDEHFSEALQNPVQHPHASGCTEPHGESKASENEYCAEVQVGDAGLEPATSTL